MLINWITDPKTGERSVSLTFLTLGVGGSFATATAKLLFSGNHVFGLDWSVFTGSDYALVIGAPVTVLGMLYRWRKKDAADAETTSVLEDEDK